MFSVKRDREDNIFILFHVMTDDNLLTTNIYTHTRIQKNDA